MFERIECFILKLIWAVKSDILSNSTCRSPLKVLYDKLLYSSVIVSFDKPMSPLKKLLSVDKQGEKQGHVILCLSTFHIMFLRIFFQNQISFYHLEQAKDHWLGVIFDYNNKTFEICIKVKWNFQFQLLI